jgi:hypothetical protein
MKEIDSEANITGVVCKVDLELATGEKKSYTVTMFRNGSVNIFGGKNKE